MHTAPEKLGGLYIHIPFCQSKCLYCDFYSITDLAKAGSFLAALEREMELAGHTMLTFDTLYIGGGTPSVMDPAIIEQIIVGAFKQFFHQGERAFPEHKGFLFGGQRIAGQLIVDIFFIIAPFTGLDEKAIRGSILELAEFVQTQFIGLQTKSDPIPGLGLPRDDCRGSR